MNQLNRRSQQNVILMTSNDHYIFLSPNNFFQVVSVDLSQRVLQHVNLFLLWLIIGQFTPPLSTSINVTTVIETVIHYSSR